MIKMRNDKKLWSCLECICGVHVTIFIKKI